MHEDEASPACARPALIEGGFPNMYISLHAPVGWCLCSLSLLPSLPASFATVIPFPPNISRNGSFSVSRYLPNPSKALLQVVDCGGIRPAWAKGFAACMVSTFLYTSHTLHRSWGYGCILSVQDMRLTTRIGNPPHYGPWAQ
jgi:hypothetical protein